MNSDDFEKRLQRVPLREIPSEWRESILRQAEPFRPSTPDPRPSFLSTLLWPHPKAWAGLAALWIGIAVVQFAASDHAVHVTKKAESPSPEAIVLLRQQTRLMAELVGGASIGDLDRPKSIVPKPRSERRIETLFV